MHRTSYLGRRVDELSDAQLLEALEMQAAGKSYGQIGNKLRVSRGSIAGWLYRVRQQVKPDRKHDGTMPARWWEAGLAVEGRDAL